MENQIVVNDYRQMDKILKEERQYLLNMVKKIQKTKCNVLLIQKSILRDAVNDLSLHFLSRLKILAIKDIERDEVEFLCKSLGCKPVANVDSFTEDKLGTADLVEEVQASGARYVKITGIKQAAQPTNQTVSIVARGANSLILDEAERSLHDALCVIRCLVKKRAMIAGRPLPMPWRLSPPPWLRTPVSTRSRSLPTCATVTPRASTTLVSASAAAV